MKIFKEKQSKKIKTCSVVMAVYKNDKSEWFIQAVDSVLSQTVKSDDIIIVRDGPVFKDLEDVLLEYEKNENITILRLSKNYGAGFARNKGIEIAKNSLLAIMDADDISEPDRFKLEIEEFNKDFNLGIVGGQVAEFQSNSDDVVSYRIVPLEHKDIVRFARRRCPFNHPTIMCKKDILDKIGGYDTGLRRSEDYDLLMRLIIEGAGVKNIDKVLLKYRQNQNNFVRKTSWRQTKEIIGVHYKFFQQKNINLLDFLIVLIGRLISFILPNKLKPTFYRFFLRKDRYE